MGRRPQRPRVQYQDYVSSMFVYYALQEAHPLASSGTLGGLALAAKQGSEQVIAVQLACLSHEFHHGPLPLRAISQPISGSTRSRPRLIRLIVALEAIFRD